MTVPVSWNFLFIAIVVFLQETYSLYGIPFLVKIKDGEPFTDLRERIRKKLDLQEKEYDKVLTVHITTSANCCMVARSNVKFSIFN